MKHQKRTVLNRTHRGLDEVSVVIDGVRHQARIEGAGRGWIHLNTAPIQPADSAVKLSVIHRGPRGGVVEVQATCLSVHHRHNRTILRLRPEQAKTARGRAFLDDFLEKTLGYPDHDLLSDTASWIARCLRSTTKGGQRRPSALYVRAHFAPCLALAVAPGDDRELSGIVLEP